MKYELIWNTADCSDGYELPWAETEEAAKEELKDTYINWMFEEEHDWKFSVDGTPLPTPEQIDRWNMMIDSWDACYCYLIPFDEETGSYSENEDDEIWLTQEELDEIGWKTIETEEE